MKYLSLTLTLLPHTFPQLFHKSHFHFEYTWSQDENKRIKRKNTYQQWNHQGQKKKTLVVRWESFLAYELQLRYDLGGLLSKLGREGGQGVLLHCFSNPRLMSAWWGSIFLYIIYFKGSVAYPRLKHWHNTLWHQLTCKDFSRNTHDLFSLLPLWSWAVFCSGLAAAAAAATVHPMCLLFRDCVKNLWRKTILRVIW